MIVVVIPAYKRLVLLLVVCRRWDFLIRHGRPPFLFTKTDEQNDENDQSEETNRERLRVKRRKLSSMTDRFCPVFLTVQRTIPEHILLGQVSAPPGVIHFRSLAILSFSVSSSIHFLPLYLLSGSFLASSLPSSASVLPQSLPFSLSFARSLKETATKTTEAIEQRLMSNC